MPPTQSEKSRKLVEQEGKILLAISDLKNKKISTIRQAIRVYKIPYITLYNQYHGISIKAEKRANGLKLSKFEEESLKKWILDLDKLGLPPRPTLIQVMANILLS